MIHLYLNHGNFVLKDSVSQSRAAALRVENKEIHLSRSEFAERTRGEYDCVQSLSPFRGVTRSSSRSNRSGGRFLAGYYKGSEVDRSHKPFSSDHLSIPIFPRGIGYLPARSSSDKAFSPCLDEPYPLRTRLNIWVCFLLSFTPFRSSLSLIFHSCLLSDVSTSSSVPLVHDKRTR